MRQQWYQLPKNQDLLRTEIAVMEPWVGKPVMGKNCGILPDGRFYWKVHVPIHKERRDGSVMFHTEYDLLLVYEANHPSVSYGSSIHCYPVGENGLARMRQRVWEHGRTPSHLPHLVTDKDNRLYLCTWNTGAFGTELKDAKGVPTAAASLKRAIYYLTNLEAGLLNQAHWEKMHKEGAI